MKWSRRQAPKGDRLHLHRFGSAEGAIGAAHAEPAVEAIGDDAGLRRAPAGHGVPDAPDVIGAVLLKITHERGYVMGWEDRMRIDSNQKVAGCGGQQAIEGGGRHALRVVQHADDPMPPGVGLQNRARAVIAAPVRDQDFRHVGQGILREQRKQQAFHMGPLVAAGNQNG